MREEELTTGFEACADRVLRFLGEEDLVAAEPEILVFLADAPPPHDRTP